MEKTAPTDRAIHLFKAGTTGAVQLAVFDAEEQVWLVLTATARVHPDRVERLGYVDLGPVPAAYELA